MHFNRNLARTLYRDPDIDYEALVVKRNAPRWLSKLAEFGILEPRGDGTLVVNWSASA